jgi:hypothetical protein
VVLDATFDASDTLFSLNTPWGGDGGALGGAISVAGSFLGLAPGGTLVLSDSLVVVNLAQGGDPGGGATAGTAGQGIGGGLDLATGSTATLKSTIVAGNRASTSNDDIFGTHGIGRPTVGAPSRPQDFVMPPTRENRRGRSRILLAAILPLALTGAAPEPAPVRFNTNFEGGSLGRIEPDGDAAFRCHVAGQQDEHGRNRQANWYYFRIDGARDRELTITLTDFLGEYNGRPGACPMGPDIRPVASDDGEHWQPIADFRWDDVAKEATIRLRPDGDSIWIAHQPPYTPRRLARLLEQVDRCGDAQIEVIGKTAEGRDLHLVTVASADGDDRAKVSVWLQARQHAWESGTSYVMEGALRFITSDDPKARALRRMAVFRFTPMVDPDGCAAGRIRFNANGYDVNRHWDEVDLRQKRYLALMPEIWYVKGKRGDFHCAA